MPGLLLLRLVLLLRHLMLLPRLMLLSPLLLLRHVLLLPRLMLLNPLLHLRHLVLLSLGQCHPVVLQSTPKARRLIPHLAVGMSLWCNS